MLSQDKTPIFDALCQYVKSDTISFHVPGHKHGIGNPELLKFLGKNTMNIDLTLMPDLDSILNPTGVIKDAQELAARAFGADNAFFLVNGTSSGIQAMILSACQEQDKIILPRNAHKSVISSIILGGLEPVYIQPKINEEYGIAMGITTEDTLNVIRKFPESKAVFVINTTYYGIASPLQELVELSHEYDMTCLVDEAHGAHLWFSDLLPISAMEANADMSASSTHKLVGSLTQSSMLFLKNDRLSPDYVKSILNLSQTTSPSYILLASLDIARKMMAHDGKALLEKAITLAQWARFKINSIPSIKCMGYDVLNAEDGFSLDPTKLCINVKNLGMTGFNVAKILREDYNIQVEMADLYNILAIVTFGDTKRTITSLVNSLDDISKRFYFKREKKSIPKTSDLFIPELAILPKEAFYSKKRKHTFRESSGFISGELIMAYPPGIPIICPGEIITEDVIYQILSIREAGGLIQGMEDVTCETISVIK